MIPSVKEWFSTRRQESPVNLKSLIVAGVVITAAGVFAESISLCGPWTFKNYEAKLSFATNRLAEAGEFTVLGATNKCDTAWFAHSGKTALPAGTEECLLLTFEVQTAKVISHTGTNPESWGYGIHWYGADGKRISSELMRHAVAGGGPGYQVVREWCNVPKDAAYIAVQAGFDSPNLGPGESVTFRNFRVSRLSAAAKAELDAQWESGDRVRAMLYPASPKPAIEAKLRDDGMAIVNGEPFFPIGVYSVCRREFNNNDLDRAFADLKAAGFNFAHTYGNSYDPDFLAAAQKHGFLLWVQARIPDKNFLTVGRHHPSILAWYLGDDTSDHITPQELADYNTLVKAADPARRLTCQADPISADFAISRFAPYVRHTDVFMPEIYPIRGKAGDKSDTNCVAQTILDMQCWKEDVRKYGDGAPRACWPILQYFKGWSGWGHFPTREQLVATSWAALIHGANGITWYTYGGFYSPKTGKYNEGVTSTPERWANIKALVTEIRKYAPVLLSQQRLQPKVEILNGPARDPLGVNPSVTCLCKVHNGKHYLFAVNASTAPVQARFTLPDGTTRTESLPPFGTVIGAW